MKKIIQKIKGLFKPVEPNFVEYLCQKRYLDRDYHAKIRAVVRYIHKNGIMTMEVYRQFLEMGISFGQVFKTKLIDGQITYKRVIDELIWLTDNKYAKEDIEKSCGVGLEGKDLEKFEYSLTFSKK